MKVERMIESRRASVVALKASIAELAEEEKTCGHGGARQVIGAQLKLLRQRQGRLERELADLELMASDQRQAELPGVKRPK